MKIRITTFNQSGVNAYIKDHKISSINRYYATNKQWYKLQ